METIRLKAIQLPDRTLELLESFAVQQRHVTADMHRKNQLRELPLHQRRHVGDGPGQQHVWFAWEDGGRVYLATAEMALELARERGQPVLEIRNYDHDGRLLDYSTWVRARNTARWERCYL